MLSDCFTTFFKWLYCCCYYCYCEHNDYKGKNTFLFSFYYSIIIITTVVFFKSIHIIFDTT